jgi:hypothetical protein
MYRSLSFDSESPLPYFKKKKKVLKKIQQEQTQQPDLAIDCPLCGLTDHSPKHFVFTCQATLCSTSLKSAIKRAQQRTLQLSTLLLQLKATCQSAALVPML